MKDEALKLAKECGATTYTNRHYPEATAVTFSPMAWEKFCEQAIAAPVQEPVCKECDDSGEIETGIGMMACTDCPPSAQPAPVQEPMGVFVEDDDIGHVRLIPHQQMKLKDGDKLYTTPPAAQRQWVGLSEEEILKMAYPIRWQEVDDFEADKAINFAQMVEAKLNEKNT